MNTLRFFNLISDSINLCMHEIISLLGMESSFAKELNSSCALHFSSKSISMYLLFNNASCIIGTPKIFVVSKFPGKPLKWSKWNLTYKFFNLFPRLYQILKLIPKLELEIFAKFQMGPKKNSYISSISLLNSLISQKR